MVVGRQAYQPALRRAIGAFGHLRSALSFRVPDAVQREAISAFTGIVDALCVAVHR
jgi:hypothetical protein